MLFVAYNFIILINETTVLFLQASRAQILKKAAEYIQFMRRKNNSHQQDIDDLKRQNILLETQSESWIFGRNIKFPDWIKHAFEEFFDLPAFSIIKFK